VEWSIVGIPANQRSWVENAIHGVFTRSLDLGLAPAVKGLFPGSYAKTIKEVFEDEAIQQKYLNIEPRPYRGEVRWDPQGDVFSYKSAWGYVTPFTRDTIGPIISSPEIVAPLTVNDLVIPKGDNTTVVTLTLGTSTEMFDQPLITAGTSTEILAKADDSDKKAQESRSHKYHIGIKESTHVTKPGEWSNVPDSEWGDPVNYRYPMPDDNHARNALSRWGDASNRSQYTSSEQSIVGGRIKRRARSLGVEVSEEEKSFWDTVEELDLETYGEGSPPPGTNLIPRTPDQPVRTAAPCGPDGDHEPMTGSHTHIHKNFGQKADGSLHTHEHTHNDDNEHTHAHTGDDGMDLTQEEFKALKALLASVAEGKTKAAIPADADLGVANAAPDWGRVASLAVSADNAVDEILFILGIPDIDRASDDSGMSEARAVLDAGKSYESFLQKSVPAEHLRHAQRAHDAIATLAAGAHCASAQSVPSEPNEMKSLAEHHRLAGIVHDALMSITDGKVCCYGMKSGEDTVEVDVEEWVKKAIAHDDIRHIQRAHDAIATMCNSLHCGAQSVPAEPNELASAQTAPTEPNQIASGEDVIVQKSTIEHHRLCGIIHDSLMKMSDGLVCPGYTKSADKAPLGDQDGNTTTSQQAQDVAFQQRQRDPDSMIGQTLKLSASFEKLADVLADFNLPAIQKSVDEARTLAQQVRSEIALLSVEAKETKQTIKSLQEMPLGRPTSFNRSLIGVEGSTNFTEKETSADSTYAGTDVVYVRGVGKCRHWPEGVMKDARPELTSEQIMVMTNSDLSSYYEGGEATVLLVD
jgi:hypothetical protein